MVSEDGLRVAISIIKKGTNAKTGEDQCGSRVSNCLCPMDVDCCNIPSRKPNGWRLVEQRTSRVLVPNPMRPWSLNDASDSQFR